MTVWLHRFVLALGLLLVPNASHADPIRLDFERFPGPDGQLQTADDTFPGANLLPLRDQFSSLGVRFSQGSLGQSAFFDGDPANHFITSTSPIGSFSSPIFGISVESFSFWDATLTAYDEASAVVAVATLVNATPGIAPVRGILTVASSTPISSFSILPTNGDNILNLDNMVLETSAPVPEPSTLVLACIGGLVGAARTRFARSGIRRR